MKTKTGSKPPSKKNLTKGTQTTSSSSEKKKFGGLKKHKVSDIYVLSVLR